MNYASMDTFKMHRLYFAESNYTVHSSRAQVSEDFLHNRSGLYCIIIVLDCIFIAL